MILHIGKDISQDQYQLYILKLFKHIKKNINKILNINLYSLVTAFKHQEINLL